MGERRPPRTHPGTLGCNRIAGSASSCGPHRSYHGYPYLPPGRSLREATSPCPITLERVWAYVAASTARYIHYNLYTKVSTRWRSAPADNAMGSKPASRRHGGQRIGGAQMQPLYRLWDQGTPLCAGCLPRRAVPEHMRLILMRGKAAGAAQRDPHVVPSHAGCRPQRFCQHTPQEGGL